MIATTSLPLSAYELRESLRQSRPVDASRLDRILRLDTPHALLEVQANTRWRDVVAYVLSSDDPAYELLSPRATVANSLAWNAPGPDGRPVVAHVESITMVTPDGQLRRVNRLNNGGLFALTLGGQGLFGALYSATLRIESLVRSLRAAAPTETLVRGKTSSPTRKLRLLIPPPALGAFVAEARTRCAEWRTSIEAAQCRRTQQEEETFLRWAQRDYVEVMLWLSERTSIGGAVRSTQLRRELIDVAIGQGGTFPIACSADATRAQTERCYPRLPSFLAEQRRIDPAGVMANAWLRHQRSLLARSPCQVRWDRQAAL